MQPGRLKDNGEAAEYLNACLEQEDDSGFLAAVRDVIDAKGGMAQLALDANMNRTSLYRALSNRGNPEFATMLGVLRALGLGVMTSALDEVRIARPGVAVNRVLSVDELDTWKRNTYLERELFGGLEEVDPNSGRRLMEGARASIDPQNLAVVTLSWEHRRVRSGGVATVIERLGEALRDSRAEMQWERPPRIVHVSPLHRRLFPARFETELQEAATTSVLYDGQNINLQIFRLISEDPQAAEWYLIDNPSKQFFQADGGRPSGGRPGRDPYFYSWEEEAQRNGIESCLLRDVLFAAQAVPGVLAALGLTRDLVIHAHDWEFALAALTVKKELARPGGLLDSAVTVLTLHNPFDHLVREKGATGDQILMLTPEIPVSHWVFPFEVRTAQKKLAPDTVLECALGLFDAPIAVVSPGFAHELCGTRSSPRDPLQRYHFAPHLASPLRYQGAVGIQNANFYPESKWRLYSRETAEAALSGDFEAILDEKRRRRKGLADAFPSALQSDREQFGQVATYGSLANMGDETITFHMSGRFDPCQKGFDVFAHAIARYLRSHRNSDVAFVLTPNVNGLEPPPFFEQLKSLASQFVGRVIVIDGFLKTLAQIQEAVCWSVWPSFYEPCGGASEPLSMGTPAIARRTGGLPTQLIYSETGETAGILYRELAPLDVNDQTAWREIEEAPTPEARMDSKLYVSMVDALVRAIEEAVEIRQNQPERHSRMLALTPEQVSAPVFSAERFGSNYWRLYKRAIS